MHIFSLRKRNSVGAYCPTFGVSCEFSMIVIRQFCNTFLIFLFSIRQPFSSANRFGPTDHLLTWGRIVLKQPQKLDLKPRYWDLLQRSRKDQRKHEVQHLDRKTSLPCNRCSLTGILGRRSTTRRIIKYQHQPQKGVFHPDRHLDLPWSASPRPSGSTLRNRPGCLEPWPRRGLSHITRHPTSVRSIRQLIVNS